MCKINATLARTRGGLWWGINYKNKNDHGVRKFGATIHGREEKGRKESSGTAIVDFLAGYTVFISRLSNYFLLCIHGSPPPISELTKCAQKPCVSLHPTPRIRRKHREILNKSCAGFESVFSKFEWDLHCKPSVADNQNFPS